MTQIEKMSARFAPVDMRVDLRLPPQNERAALAKLVEASRLVDALFLRQRSAANETQLLQLLEDELRSAAPG